MFFDDHKKAVTTILSKRNGKGERTHSPTEMMPENHRTEDLEMDGRHVAAQDILSAHQEKSPQKLMEALANFIDLHQAKGMAPEKDEGPSSG